MPRDNRRMHGFGPHLVTALLIPRDPYEPDADRRALSRLAAKTTATARPRRRLRLHRQESGWVTVSTVRSRDEASSA
jgi:hypothetical protein